MSIQYVPVTSRISVDGRSRMIGGFNINNNIYYKLRDMAYLLNGTNKQFDVVYDIGKSAIVMQPGKSYLGQKSEEDVSNIKDIKLEERQVSLYLQDKYHQILGYMINGNTYVKIRNIVELLEVEIEWSNETKEIKLITEAEYRKAI